MANIIKYTTSSETQALKKDNFYIGVGDVAKGPTSSSGYYNGYIPPLSGYTIYLNKASDGPSIYSVDSDAQLISLTSKISGQNLSTTYDCFLWFRNQTDKMVVNRDYEGIVTNGLVFNLDAGFVPSYLRAGTTWYDLSSNNNNGTLINGPTWSSTGGGSIIFDGSDDYVNQTYPTTNFPSGSQANTINIWLKIPSTNSQGMEPFGMGNNNGNASRIGIWLPGTAQNGNGTSVGQIGAESLNSIVATTNIQTTNTWLNFCAVFGGGLEDNFTLYVNGSSVSMSKYGRAASNPVTMNISVNSSFLTFGGIPSVPNAHVYNGPIPITQVYNRALSTSEVLQNYNAQLSRFPILDFYSGSPISVSLRLLSSSYNSYAIRVRRSSDNTEQDIGFVNGVLDTASLLNFCGNGNGFVSRWYNQGSAGSYFRNTTATEQPMIVTGGTINKVNGQPSILFDGVDDNLLGLGISMGYGAANMSIFAVGKRNGSSKYLTFTGTYEGYSGLWLGQGIDDKYGFESSTTVGPGKASVSTTTDTTSNQLVLTGIFDGTNSKIYKNGSEVTTSQSTANYDRGFNWIGRRAGNPPNTYQRFMDGNIQEILSYESNQTNNRTSIETSIKTYYGI